MNEKNKIDRYFREALGDFEQSPPETSWESVVQRLGERRKKRAAFLIFRIAAGMAILLSTGIAYHIITQPSENSGRPVLSAKTQNNRSVTDNATRQVENAPNPERMNPVVSEPVNSASGNAEIAKSNLVNHSGQPSVKAGQITDEQRKQVSETAIESMVATINDPSLTRLNPSYKSALLQSRIATLEFDKDRKQEDLTEEQMIALLLGENTGVEPSNTNKKQWLLGSEIAPLYSYRNIQSKSVESEVISDLNKGEEGIIAYAGGIRIAVSAGKRLTIQSGLYYSRYGQEKNQAGSYIESLANTSYAHSEQYITVRNSTGTIISNTSGKEVNDFTPSGNAGLIGDAGSNNSFRYEMLTFKTMVPQNQIEDVTLRQYFDYIELPLIAKYKIIDRKIDFSLTGGIVTNFLIGNSVKMLQNGETSTVGETSNINQINYQGSFGLGLEYPVISHFALTLEPRFRYYINPIAKSSSIEVRPFSFGFFAGFNYRF